MLEKELYTKILGIEKPWIIQDVTINIQEHRIDITIIYDDNVELKCPVCDKVCPGYDKKRRSWRHLDTCQYQTFIHTPIPRCNCSEHGVRQIPIPWVDGKAHFTALFEWHEIALLKETSIQAATRLTKISWDEASGIQERAVKRGLSRREHNPTKHLALDEISFQRKHDYVTIITDREKKEVIDVLDDRKADTLSVWLQKMPENDRNSIESVTLDMWDPYINALKKCIPNAKEKICFDRYHVAAHFGKALDKVRANEHITFLSKQGKSPLTKTKYEWQRNASRCDNRSRKEFMKLTRMALKTARAWSIKEMASSLWNYAYIGLAEKMWKRLLRRISLCRLDPVKKVGKMIRNYLWGILNATCFKVTNAIAESKNASIQKIKYIACGFRNRSRFRNAILFHFGGLDLMPAGINSG